MLYPNFFRHLSIYSFASLSLSIVYAVWVVSMSNEMCCHQQTIGTKNKRCEWRKIIWKTKITVSHIWVISMALRFHWMHSLTLSETAESFGFLLQSQRNDHSFLLRLARWERDMMAWYALIYYVVDIDNFHNLWTMDQCMLKPTLLLIRAIGTTHRLMILLFHWFPSADPLIFNFDERVESGSGNIIMWLL